MKLSQTRKRRKIAPLVAVVALGLTMVALGLLITVFRAYPQEEPRVYDRLLELTMEESFPRGPLQATTRFDSFLLEKEKRLLIAYENGIVVRRYKVALGRTPVGAKEYEGDGKTPEGLYYIDNKNPNSAFYKNVNISYPDDEDRKRAAKAGKSPGGLIKIHGLAPSFAFIGNKHRLTDWTEGCVALTNEEMEEVFSRTVLGSPITIVP